MARIGILALQGAVEPHARALCAIGHEAVEVRYAVQLDDICGLVLPGGESTTQRKLLESAGLIDGLDAFARAGRPILATCAGLILAATPGLSWLDVDVIRNGWGRQVESCETTDDSGRHRIVLIRAPRITRVGPSVEVLATLGGEPILVRRGAIVGATFHPELTDDVEIHRSVFPPILAVGPACEL